MAWNMQITWDPEPSLKARKSPASNEPPAQVTTRDAHTKDLAGRSNRFALFRAGGGSALATLITATWRSLRLLRFLPFLWPQKPAHLPATPNPDTR